MNKSEILSLLVLYEKKKREREINELVRDSANTNDTYTGKAGLLYIDTHFEINSVGSKTEYSK